MLAMKNATDKGKKVVVVMPAYNASKTLEKTYSEIDFEIVDDVILGCANQAGEDNRNVARMALLLAG